MAAIALTLVAGGFAGSVALCWGAKKIYDQLGLARTIREVEREGWTHIGKVKFICIYPIDGGRGMELNIANFGRYGFQSLPDLNDIHKRVHYDRGFVIFDLGFNPLRAILNETQISIKSNKEEAVALLWHTLKIVATTFNLSSSVKHILYLNREMCVAVPNTQIREKVKVAYDIQGSQYEIGYFSQLKRVEFNDNARHLLELRANADCHLPNFTSCTMVNSKSINHLRNATGRPDLSYKNFRPQIVFEGKKAYIEENVRSIKIGNLEFHNVRPCTHDEGINMNYEQSVVNETSKFRMFFRSDNLNRLDPFKYLSRYRPLSKTGSPAYRSSTSPVFGINFHFEPRELDEDNLEMIDVRETENPAFFTIARGHQVYAKFNPPRSHADTEHEIAF